jgi:hypothetical protein
MRRGDMTVIELLIASVRAWNLRSAGPIRCLKQAAAFAFRILGLS